MYLWLAYTLFCRYQYGGKKPSGAWFRKRRKENEGNAKKFKGSFEKYLLKQDNELLSTSSSAQEQETVIETRVDGRTKNDQPQAKEDDTVTDTGNVLMYVTTSKNDNVKEDDTTEELQPEKSSTVIIDFSDPASWDTLNISQQTLRTMLVEHGPEQVKGKGNFPKGLNNRKFSDVHYKRRLPNGEEVYREYLQYSRSTDKAFCFCCKVFGINVSSALAQSGCNDWHNISAIIGQHETADEHLNNYKKWKTLKKNLEEGTTIDHSNERKIKEEETYWQQILERLISLVRTLGTQNLAFRGVTEKLDAHDNGNFLKFIEYLSMFDPVMNEHLRRIRSDEKRHTHYLGKNIQNELIQILASAIKREILSSVQKAKYFSIILDCTPDVSHTEQMTMIIRFVQILSSSEVTSKNESDLNQVLVKEHFLGFMPLQESTGSSMTEVVLEKLKDMSLPVENIRGQGYDNGSNMKGKESGVQRRILDINPRAFYVPCCSHTLNLVVNDAASCCLEVTSFFDVVQRTYVFFSASTRRWVILCRHVPSLTVKPLSDTRWSSRIDALTPLRYLLSSVCDALEEIYEDSSLTGSSGIKTKAEALALLKNISNFKFVVALVTWHNILFQVNLTSKILQEKDLSLQRAVSQLKKTEQYLISARSDLEFNRTLVDAREVAEEVGIEPVFEKEKVRIRKKTRMFDYEATDESANVTDPSENFKIHFYFAALDTAINAVKERFFQLNEVSATFGFLYDIRNLKNKNSAEIKLLCENLEKALTVQNKEGVKESDIDALGLCSELRGICHHLNDSVTTPEEVLSYIYHHDLENGFPNICVALRILLTLPLSVASAERSFSKLKLIKTYLRSTMSQERLVGLATISIESDLAKHLDPTALVKEFSKIKARKAPLGL